MRIFRVFNEAIAIASFAAALLMPFDAAGQTTQGLISGQVTDSITREPLGGAKVEYSLHLVADAPPMPGGAAKTDGKGHFMLPLLSPGIYTLIASKPGYQTQEVNELELFVAAALSLDFPLRPMSDIWDKTSKTYTPEGDVLLHYYATDVDHLESANIRLVPAQTSPLQSTLSYVFDSQAIRELPLAGRDVYSMLAMVAGVTSDAPTSRSLGLVVNGQRPSSSNFLLDGVENNNYLTTGPLLTPPPEGIQEYRISTNNFSAEYGRTGGYLANVITRPGQNSWHGTLFSILKNEALNANDFQRNLKGQPRTPLKEWEPGFFVGGPLISDALYISATLDYLRFRSRQDTQSVNLPSASFAPGVGTQAEKLLRLYPAPGLPAGTDCGNTVCAVNLTPPFAQDRLLVQPRADYLFHGGEQRFMTRLTYSRTSRPDFLWTPYQGFSTALNENVSGLTGAWSGRMPGGFLTEVRFGWNSGDLRFDRPHSEVPTLSSGDGVTLPGSPAFYGYRNKSAGQEWIANASKLAGRHIVKFGAGFLARRVDGYLTAGRDGIFFFGDINDFGRDSPYSGIVSLSRLKWPQQLVQPDYNRKWNYDQFFLYLQDTYKVSRRLVLNLGLRYENYGAPRSTGDAPDAIIQAGDGTTLADRLSKARLVQSPNQLYSPENKDWGVRTGVSWSPGNARTVLRGGYGLYFERPFDNLWQNLRNNNNLLADFTPPAGFNYLASFPALKNLGFQGGPCGGAPICDNQDLAQFTLYDPHIGNARVHNYFAGLQHQIATNVSVEVNGVGSAGRNLVTTDIVNRQFSTAVTPDNLQGRINPAFPDIHYRASQGRSDYNALTAVFRYRTARAYFQASYAWSHTIDNQSEPLAGDFFDLRFTSGAAQGFERKAAFTRQFSPDADRGNSDFDQRHNLAFFSIWNLPAAFPGSKGRAVFRDWKFAQLAAIRSGLPFTVGVPQSVTFFHEQILNNRADITNRDLIFSGQGTASPGGGGVNWFNPAAFGKPTVDAVGTSGRNAFHGPGFFNLDISLSRSFALPKLGEASRLTVRADAFNSLNHANLNNPVSILQFQGAGVASYGRLGNSTGFPASTPFAETARQIQIQLRISF